MASNWMARLIPMAMIYGCFYLGGVMIAVGLGITVGLLHTLKL